MVGTHFTDAAHSIEANKGRVSTDPRRSASPSDYGAVRMKVGIVVTVLLPLLTIGCGQEVGPDSISTRTAHPSSVFPDCVSCHDAPTATRRQIFGAAGDFGDNSNVLSHHIAGSSDPTSAQCLVCHDQSTHTQGTIRLNNADTGASIFYDPANPATLEPFCLSCHDADGATATSIGASAFEAFSNGSVLGNSPYPYATRIATSWAKPYGHGPNGNHSPGDQLTCIGTGQPGTGCHGNNGIVNAHGSVNQVLATEVFIYNTSSTYIEADYALCFNCHANYSGVTKEDTFGVLGGGLLDGGYGPAGPNGNNPPYYTTGVTTHFADHNEPGGIYNDPVFFGQNFNLHWFHISAQTSDFRGTGVASGINCINCHDVHGSATPYGTVYDEIGYTNIIPDGTNVLGKMADAAYGPLFLDNNPTYCGIFNCHGGFGMGITNAWFEPIVE